MPDGRMISLPIPDDRTQIRYSDLMISGLEIGQIVESLSRGKTKSIDSAHLDPDLDSGTLDRPEGWRPIFGQTGSSHHI